MRVRRRLEVHTAQNAGHGRGKEFLAHLHPDAMRRQLILVEWFDEASTVILENKGTQDFDARKRLGDQFHESYFFFTNRRIVSIS